MIQGVSHKTKQFFFVLIKVSIVCGAFYFIYQRLIENENVNFNDFISQLIDNQIFSAENLLVLLVLTSYNWYLEILKWKVLATAEKPITFYRALVQCLGGLTASLITPNRIGDYGAKAMYYKPRHRKKILLLNLIGHFWQMVTTCSFGIVGFILFINNYPVSVNYINLSLIVLLIGTIGITLGLVLKFQNFKIKGVSFKRALNFTRSLHSKIHFKTLLLSVIRYTVFSFQFYVLLHFFNINMSLFDAIIGITSMYFLASIVPSLVLFDVVIKGGVALYLFSFMGVDDLTIICVTLMMWLLNFALPSVVGSYFILNFKLPKTEQWS